MFTSNSNILSVIGFLYLIFNKVNYFIDINLTYLDIY